MPVGQAPQHQSQAMPVGAARVIDGGVKQVAAQRPKNVELVPVLKSQHQPPTVARPLLQRDVYAIELRRSRQLAAAIFSGQCEDVLANVIAATEEV